jgi:hypothetical protein
MASRSRVVGLFCWFLVFGLQADHVSAQSSGSPASFAVGYSAMHDFAVEENFPGGWFANFGYELTSWLSAVGEIGGTHKRYDFGEFTRQGPASPTDTANGITHLFTYLAGVRYARPMGGVIPFAQILGGMARGTGDVRVFGETIAETQIDPVLQIGGGLDTYFNSRVGLRVGADFRRIYAAFDGNNEARVTIGVVIGVWNR